MDFSSCGRYSTLRGSSEIYPELVGYYNTSGTSYGAHMTEDGMIYVADQTNMGIYRFWEDGLPPYIDLSADTLNFNEVYLDSSSVMPLIIVNTGYDDLIVSEILLDEEQFSTDFDTLFVLEPNSMRVITVTFTPEEL